VVLVEDVGPVRRLTMNRPDALNALNGELIEALSEAIGAAGEDDTVHVVIVRGAGRAFCAGYDLNEDAAEGEHDARHWHEELAKSTERMLEFTDCPKPTIAQVHSYCLAGGTDLMLACDLAVVADDAKFGYVDIRFGSGVVSMFLPWVGACDDCSGRFIASHRTRVTSARGWDGARPKGGAGAARAGRPGPEAWGRDRLGFERAGDLAEPLPCHPTTKRRGPRPPLGGRLQHLFRAVYGVAPNAGHYRGRIEWRPPDGRGGLGPGWSPWAEWAA
jgi:hypothetical protein